MIDNAFYNSKTLNYYTMTNPSKHIAKPYIIALLFDMSSICQNFYSSKNEGNRGLTRTSSGVALKFVSPKLPVISTISFDEVEISNACSKLASAKLVI